MNFVSMAVLIGYMLFVMVIILYMGRKSISITFFTGVLMVVLGYIVHIPYFNLTAIALLSMIIAGVIVYKLFLKGDER